MLTDEKRAWIWEQISSIAAGSCGLPRINSFNETWPYPQWKLNHYARRQGVWILGFHNMWRNKDNTNSVGVATCRSLQGRFVEVVTGHTRGPAPTGKRWQLQIQLWQVTTAHKLRLWMQVRWLCVPNQRTDLFGHLGTISIHVNWFQHVLFIVRALNWRLCLLLAAT